MRSEKPLRCVAPGGARVLVRCPFIFGILAQIYGKASQKMLQALLTGRSENVPREDTARRQNAAWGAGRRGFSIARLRRRSRGRG
jgi:hypothetical protein